MAAESEDLDVEGLVKRLTDSARFATIEADSHARDLARESSGRETIARSRAALYSDAAAALVSLRSRLTNADNSARATDDLWLAAEKRTEASQSEAAALWVERNEWRAKYDVERAAYLASEAREAALRVRVGELEKGLADAIADELGDNWRVRARQLLKEIS